MHALIIRELKERKNLIILGIILCILPPVIRLCTAHSASMIVRECAIPLGLVLFVFLFVLFPMVAAESSIAGEVEKKTLSFLFSLPLSRTRIWWAKLLSLALMNYGLILFYLLANSFILPFHRMNGEGFVYFLLAAILAPSVFLALSLLASTLTSKSMVSSATALLLIMLAVIAQFFIFTGMEWSISPHEFLLVGLAFMAVPLGLSYLLFTRASFFDGAQKLSLFFRFGLGGLVALSLLVLLINLGCLAISENDYLGIDSVAPMHGRPGLLAGVQCRGLFNSRMWLLDTERGNVRKFRERKALSPICAGSGRIAYDTIRKGDGMFKGMIPLQHWIMDARTSERTLMATSSVCWSMRDAFMQKGAENPDGSGTLFFVLPVVNHNEGSREYRLDVMLVNSEGKAFRNLRLPQIIDTGTVVADEKRIAFDAAKSIECRVTPCGSGRALRLLVPALSKKDKDEKFLALDHIDLASGKMRILAEMPLPDNLRLMDMALSPDGSRAAVLLKDRRGMVSLSVAGAGRDIRKPLLEKADGFLRCLRWVGDRLAVIQSGPGESSSLCLVDSDTGASEVLLTAPAILSFQPAPGGERIAVCLSSIDHGACSFAVLDALPRWQVRHVKGLEFARPAGDRFSFLWVDDERFICRLWPWEIYEANCGLQDMKVRKLFSSKEDK